VKLFSPPSTSLRVTARPRAKHSNSAATQSGLSDAVGRALLSIEARYRHLWQKPGFSVMRDTKLKCDGGEERRDAFFCLRSDPAFHRLDSRRRQHCDGRDRSPAEFISPKDGDTVVSPFRVQFGLSGMGVAPAGVDTPNTDHHHLLIDVDESLDPKNRSRKIRSIFISVPDKPRRSLNCHRENIHFSSYSEIWSHHLFHPPLTSDVITVNVN
jgi:Domain of unknown function (DUF4399)